MQLGRETPERLAAADVEATEPNRPPGTGQAAQNAQATAANAPRRTAPRSSLPIPAPRSPHGCATGRRGRQGACAARSKNRRTPPRSWPTSRSVHRRHHSRRRGCRAQAGDRTNAARASHMEKRRRAAGQLQTGVVANLERVLSEKASKAQGELFASVPTAEAIGRAIDGAGRPRSPGPPRKPSTSLGHTALQIMRARRTSVRLHAMRRVRPSTLPKKARHSRRGEPFTRWLWEYANAGSPAHTQHQSASAVPSQSEGPASKGQHRRRGACHLRRDPAAGHRRPATDQRSAVKKYGFLAPVSRERGPVRKIGRTFSWRVLPASVLASEHRNIRRQSRTQPPDSPAT